jgi:predicted lipid-binding transport protein (Tim44 family)
MAGLITGVLGVLLTLGAFTDAEAGRLGGGKSFGSRPAYSAPYQSTTPPAAVSPGRATAGAAAPAAVQNAAQRQALAGRGGLMGALGGLALGGLLGALFFGGAFENLNLFDIAVVLGLAALAYYLFASLRRRGASAAPVASAYGPSATAGTDAAGEPVMRRDAPADAPRASGWAPTGASADEAPTPVPPGFDTAAFLEGAKRAYGMLQQAWDRGDLSDLRALTTDDVFAELQDQLRARQGENRTEVLHLEARLLEARQAGNELEASVLFDAFLREVDAAGGDEARGQQVKEVWHFIRPAGNRQPTWFLDGIQQLA